jgi:fatty acid desaturase
VNRFVGPRSIGGLLLHLLRTAISQAGVATGVLLERPELTAFFAAAVFFSAFSFQHDLIHGALAVPSRLRHPLLAVVGALMQMSGHGTKVTHLHHHRRTFAEDDLEGLTAHVGWGRALLLSPLLSVRCRVEGWRRAGASDRRWQVAETIANVASVFVLPWPVVLVNVALGLAMPFWAGRIPHRAPAELVRLARKLDFSLSPTILSLAYHELHHEHPHVPTHRLGLLASSLERSARACAS